MGLLSILFGLAGGSYNGGENPREIIRAGLYDALDTMDSMIVNEGQRTVFDQYLKDEFQNNASANIDDGWEDVDAGDYIDFMGEIVEEGNYIMQDAFNYAEEVASEAEEAEEGEEGEEGSGGLWLN